MTAQATAAARPGRALKSPLAVPGATHAMAHLLPSITLILHGGEPLLAGHDRRNDADDGQGERDVSHAPLSPTFPAP
ncbi:MAG: hypothetical protein ACRDOI_40920 [Trebonia sp.]